MSGGDPELGFEHVFEPGPGPATLLLLHATGGDERQLLPIGRELAPGAALLSPRGKVLEAGAVRRFFARHGPGRLDIADLKARSDELAGFLTAAVAAYGRDPDRVIALGYSNGANIAVDLLLRHSEALRGAALLRPMLPYSPDSPPDLEGVDVLVADGEHDPYSADGAADALSALLAAAGATVTRRTAAAGHELTQADLDAVAGWLEGRLNP